MLLHLRLAILIVAAAVGCVYLPQLADDPAPRTAGVIGDVVELPPTILASSR